MIAVCLSSNTPFKLPSLVLQHALPMGHALALVARAAELAVFLASDASGTLSGRVIQSTTDDVTNLPTKTQEIMASDLYTMRRVEPPERH